MNDMTANNLKSAYGGESMAHMRYLQWGAFATKEGYPNVGNLFKAVAYAEQVHAHNHFRELKNEAGDSSVTAGAGFGLSTTSDHLQGAIDGENYEVDQMYPAFMAVAELQEEKGSMRTFHYAIEAEKTHAIIFGKAKEAVDAKQDFAEDTVHVCDVCGYTLTGALEDNCPVCKVKKEMFTTFTTGK